MHVLLLLMDNDLVDWRSSTPTSNFLVFVILGDTRILRTIIFAYERKLYPYRQGLLTPFCSDRESSKLPR